MRGLRYQLTIYPSTESAQEPLRDGLIKNHSKMARRFSGQNEDNLCCLFLFFIGWKIIGRNARRDYKRQGPESNLELQLR